ncbi:MAG: hypothetical protein JWR61_2144 [Ferruginibacter sp.]|nr:hypothetical protein [Ferruginibacter sp.]
MLRILKSYLFYSLNLPKSWFTQMLAGLVIIFIFVYNYNHDQTFHNQAIPFG